jgi:hypothetical protein
MPVLENRMYKQQAVSLYMSLQTLVSNSECTAVQIVLGF